MTLSKSDVTAALTVAIACTLCGCSPPEPASTSEYWHEENLQSRARSDCQKLRPRERVFVSLTQPFDGIAKGFTCKRVIAEHLMYQPTTEPIAIYAVELKMDGPLIVDSILSRVWVKQN